jgi:5'-nucleotidase
MIENIESQHALIDLDGTVADFDKGMTGNMLVLASPSEPDYSTYDWSNAPAFIKARRNLIKRQPGFWRNLEKIDDGFKVIDLLEKHDFSLAVLTKGPRKNSLAWAEKVEWCGEHLPQADITITYNKSRVYSRILFDDFPPYFEGWLQVRPRGLVIAIKHPWNCHTDDPRVVLFDGSNLDQVEEAIIKVKNRKSGEHWL